MAAPETVPRATLCDVPSPRFALGYDVVAIRGESTDLHRVNTGIRESPEKTHVAYERCG